MSLAYPLCLEFPTIVSACLLNCHIALQGLENQVLRTGSGKCQHRRTDALHVLWRAKALLQGTAGDSLYTEKQIIGIPCSVIKSHSWPGEIPTTTFLPPPERRKPMIIPLPFIIIRCGINWPGLELSSAQEGQYMNIPCVSRGHFK